LTGDIQNNGSFGPDFLPDWFSNDLTDLAPAVVNSNLAHTWFNEFSSYTGGRLDYMLYTPSSIYEVNKYVIDSRIMSQSDLFLSGLSQSDSQDCSDHLMVVSDWSFNPISNTQEIKYDITVVAFPNPFDQDLTISVQDDRNITSLKVIDLNGKLIQSYGSIYARSFSLDSGHLHSGVYFVALTFNDGSTSMIRIAKN